MNKLMILAASLAAQFAVLPAHAAEEAKQPTAQQQKMTECNKKATGMKGDERKKFMSECLSAKSSSAADTKAPAADAKAADDKSANSSQQDKMKVCNEKATGMKGDERKKFMSECLSAKPAADTKAADAKAGAETKAADAKPATTSQQDKMKVCNEKATGKKGDERKKFMSECLSG
ncbi:PsiF family protein [Niveibacterium sp. 24ML]|uniref:PsiF family protein n=1 Tax=Niveibacterium sp. 24ML TaxID=2985512 RepID=UPI003B641622